MKVGIWSPYLETFGGGERYILTIAEYFLQKGENVNLFWDKTLDLKRIKDRFDIDLEGIKIIPNVFSSHNNILKKLISTIDYDLIIFLSDGSIPTSLARKNILHFQIPFVLQGQKNLINWLKFQQINHEICNSAFTKFYIDKTFGIESKVVYPPIDLSKFKPGRKENIILSVGRFFSPSHPKQQEILVEAFKGLIAHGLSGWKLILMGGVTGNSNDSVENLRQKAKKFPIEILTDSNFSILTSNYSRARIYWHAAGFGQTDPQKVEHFGITTVEAMASGCVPVVYGAGGQKEIVDHGNNGYLWSTALELEKLTATVIKDNRLSEKISLAAQERAKNFSKEIFLKRIDDLLK